MKERKSGSMTIPMMPAGREHLALACGRVFPFSEPLCALVKGSSGSVSASRVAGTH